MKHIKILQRDGYWKKFQAELDRTEKELALKRKDAILHLRINSRDLEKLKAMATKYGMKYQTFIAETLHQTAGQ